MVFTKGTVKVKEKWNYINLSPQLSLVKKFIDKQRDAINLIKMDKFRSADEKRNELDKMQQQINDYTYNLINYVQIVI